MSWYEWHIHATASDWTFAATGTRDLVWQSASLTHEHGWSLGGDLLLIGLAASIPVLLGFWTPARPGAAALMGAGLALLAYPLYAIAYLAEPLTRAAVGMSKANAKAARAVFSQHGLPGLWMALVAVGALLLIGFGRAVYAGAGART
jgi:hypothetical protein